MKRTAITALKGNIVTQSDCDGIANSANAYLIAGSGVCGAIYVWITPEARTPAETVAPDWTRRFVGAS